MPSHKELTASMRVILKTADLDCLSAKQVRKQLEEEYDCQLTQHKKFIDDKLMELIDEMGSDDGEEEKEKEEEEEEEGEEERSPEKEKKTEKVKEPAAKKKRRNSDSEVSSSDSDSEFLKNNSTSSRKRSETKKKRDGAANIMSASDRSCKQASKRTGSKDDVRVSPELAKIIGAEVLPRSEISLRLHQEVLSRQLHEGQDRMYIICDEDFKAVFGLERLRVSTLTNHCKKHIFKVEREEVPGSKTKKKSGYGKPVWLSPELSELLGYNHMSRSSVIKEMWKLIKSRGLQDPKNKKFMLVEDDMMPIFKAKRIQTFGMMKYLVNHMSVEEDEFVSSYVREYPKYDPDAVTNGTTQGS